MYTTTKTAKYFKNCCHTDDEIEAVNELSNYKIGKEIIATYDCSDYEDNCFDDVMYRVSYELGFINESEDESKYSTKAKNSIQKWIKKYASLCKCPEYACKGWM